MSKQITVTSFEELAQVFQSEQVAPDAGERVEHLAEPTLTDPSELAELIAELQRAGGTLAAIARKDDEARRQALSELERYDALVSQQAEAEAVCKRARQVRRQAHELAETAFESDAREAAEH